MTGARGFSDPNAQVNPDVQNVFHQLVYIYWSFARVNWWTVFHRYVGSDLSSATDNLLPWYINYLGGSYNNATQCMNPGSNQWVATHQVYNGSLNNMWVENVVPWTWGFFQKEIFLSILPLPRSGQLETCIRGVSSYFDFFKHFLCRYRNLFWLLPIPTELNIYLALPTSQVALRLPI